MSKTKRVINVLEAILMIQMALILMLVPEEAFKLIAILVGLILTVYGLKYIIYYLTHAQHMTGGKRLLLVGLILFDAGTFAMVIYDRAKVLMVGYIVAVHLVASVLNFARAYSNKGDGNPAWKIDLAQGIGNFIQVVLCLVFINHVEIPVYIYCLGVIYSAVLKIIASFRRTAIVYVQ